MISAIAGMNPAEGIDGGVLCCVVCCVLCVVCCVGSGLCDHLMNCSEDSYWVCLCE